MKLSAALNGRGSFRADVTRRATRQRQAPALNRQAADCKGGQARRLFIDRGHLLIKEAGRKKADDGGEEEGAGFTQHLAAHQQSHNRRGRGSSAQSAAVHCDYGFLRGLGLRLGTYLEKPSVTTPSLSRPAAIRPQPANHARLFAPSPPPSQSRLFVSHTLLLCHSTHVVTDSHLIEIHAN